MRWITAAFLAALLGTPAGLAQTPAQKSLFVGEVIGAKMVMLSQDLPELKGEIWTSEVYELKLEVRDLLAGADPGEIVTVRVMAHARKFDGMSLVILIDPTSKAEPKGISWWNSIKNLACVPKEIVDDAAFASDLSFREEFDGRIALDDDPCTES